MEQYLEKYPLETIQSLANPRDNMIPDDFQRLFYDRMIWMIVRYKEMCYEWFKNKKRKFDVYLAFRDPNDNLLKGVKSLKKENNAMKKELYSMKESCKRSEMSYIECQVDSETQTIEDYEKVYNEIKLNYQRLEATLMIQKAELTIELSRLEKEISIREKELSEKVKAINSNNNLVPIFKEVSEDINFLKEDLIKIDLIIKCDQPTKIIKTEDGKMFLKKISNLRDYIKEMKLDNFDSNCSHIMDILTLFEVMGQSKTFKIIIKEYFSTVSKLRTMLLIARDRLRISESFSKFS
jgi:hypothetical protein